MSIRLGSIYKAYKVHSFFLNLTLVGCCILQSCKSDQPTPPTPNVSVVKAISKEVTDFDEYSGHLESPEAASVAARVSGIITHASFSEGSIVKAGDLLFTLDDRWFKAEVASKEADVAKAQASLSASQAQVSRYQSVKGTKAISAQDYDQAIAALQQAQAQIDGARAALDIAKLDLEWTQVTAPIAGRVGRKLVTEGNLVNGGAGIATKLTSITSVDPMYSYINVPERSFLKYQELITQQSGERSTTLPCSAQLENESDFPNNGSINFIDNHIDPATGTIEMRCSIPNSNGKLTAGLFSRTRVQASRPYKATLVPDVAIANDQNSKYVLVVAADGTVKNQAVKLGVLFGKLRVISEGINAGDAVIVNGIQSARPGNKVNPTELSLSAEGLIITPTPVTSVTPATQEKK